MTMTFRLRPLTSADGLLLRELLYHAIHVPPGEEPPPRDIVDTPEMHRYIAAFGRAGDCGWVARETATGKDVGAVWLRLLPAAEPGHGFVDEHTPELAIALLPGYRGRGLGTRLMRRLLEGAEGKAPISLSVSDGNPARRLYERMGFRFVAKEGDSSIMLRPANAPSDQG